MATGPPSETPIGLLLSRTAKQLGRRFDDALAAAGGTQSTWLILLSLKTGRATTQRELAAALELREPTVTHHLSAMEADGLLTRQRDPDNRRVQRMTLTAAGEAMFLTLRDAASEFDARLRHGLSDREVAALRRTLGRVLETTAPHATPPALPEGAPDGRRRRSPARG